MQVKTRADARTIKPDIRSVVDGWYPPNVPLDMEDLLDRLESRGHDLGDSMISEAVLEVQAIARSIRREMSRS